MKEPFSEIFKEGGHKNSLGCSEEVLGEVLENKERLPELYESISDPDAWVRMRAIDWISTLLSTTSADWIVAVNAMNTLKTFTEEGWLKKSKFKSLVTIQLKHTSKSVVKRAYMYLSAV
ncbi:MAG: hypothetical protein ACOCXT_04525 [Candidatus Dojkabacteria bacterium]